MNSNKNKAIRPIFIIIVIVIILTVCSLIYNKNKNKDKYEKIKVETIQQSSQKVDTNIILDELEITNIEILVENGETQVRATVYNKTDKKLGNINTKIILQNDKNQITKMSGYIPSVSPGYSTNITSSINKEIKEVKNVNIEKGEN